MDLRSVIRKVMNMLLVILSILIFQGCNDVRRQDYVINDFEMDSDLNRLNWKCHTIYSLSSENIGNGVSSLKMEMYPSLYPGVSFREFSKNWKGYSHLCAEMTNPHERRNLVFVVRIDDIEDAPDYKNRCNLRMILKPGLNRIDIPFETFITPSGRKLDLSHITALSFFMVNPSEKITVFLDHVRLTR